MPLGSVAGMSGARPLSRDAVLAIVRAEARALVFQKVSLGDDELLPARPPPLAHDGPPLSRFLISQSGRTAPVIHRSRRGESGWARYRLLAGPVPDGHIYGPLDLGSAPALPTISARRLPYRMAVMGHRHTQAPGTRSHRHGTGRSCLNLPCSRFRC